MPETVRSTVPLKVTGAGATDIGGGRKHNEDAVLLRPDLNLYLVADGAGGHNAGNVASALATTSIANYLEETADTTGTRPELDAYGIPIDARRLSIAIQHANRDIIEIANTSNRRRGMGSTIVGALIDPGSATVHVAHVGDSRCYRLRAGHLELLTFDHSLVHEVLELRPDLDDESMAKLPRHVVTRALGMEDQVRASVRSHEIVPDDRYLLCSDGLTDALEPEQIADVLRLPKTPEELVTLLIDLAKNAGGQDNIAALVVHCEATGVTGPARVGAIPRPRRAPAPAITPTTSSDEAPEIVMMSSEAEPELEWETPIHVVPAEAANAGMIDALEGLMAPTRAGAARERARRARCTSCKRVIEPDLKTCPYCNATVGGSS